MRVEYSTDYRNDYAICEQIIGFDGKHNYLLYIAYPGKIYTYGMIKGIKTAVVGISDLGYNLTVCLKYYPGTESINKFPEVITGVSVLRLYMQPEYNLITIESISGTYHIKASDIRDMTIR